MKTILMSRQSGFAIIEALIAFLVLGIGVAALLYLQGNLMSNSSLSKARAEAMELGKDRTEVLRNYIDKRQFLSALGSVIQDDPVDGVNAKYIVCYAGIPIIPANPTPDDVIALLKTPVDLEITVKWPGAEGGAVTCSAESSKDEKVTLETKLYFLSPVIASGIVTGDEEGDDFFPLISPFITGVEKEHDSTKSQELSGTEKDEYQVMVVDDITGDISFTDVDILIKTYSNIETGRSNVEVVHGTNADGTPKVVLTSFGGIVHKIEGDIIVDDNANSTLSDLGNKGDNILGLFASPPSYCLFSICNDAADGQTEVCTKETTEDPSNEWEYASYVCYVPGDCTYGSVDMAGSIDTRCPDPFSTNPLAPPFAPPPGMDDLNGGWYGRVGNFHVELPQDKVCAANTDIDDKKTPSREYVTYRYGDLSDTDIITGNEGINTPYGAQTFLIVDNKVKVDCLERMALIPGSNLVNDRIRRQLYGAKKPKTDPLILSQDNVVFPLNECAGGLECPPPTLLLP